MAEQLTTDVGCDNAEDRTQDDCVDAGDHMQRHSHRSPPPHPRSRPLPAQTKDETPQASTLPMQKPQAQRILQNIISPRKTPSRGHRNQLNFCPDDMDFSVVSFCAVNLC